MASLHLPAYEGLRWSPTILCVLRRLRPSASDRLIYVYEIVSAFPDGSSYSAKLLEGHERRLSKYKWLHKSCHHNGH